MKYIYKLTLNRNISNFKRGSIYIGQHNGNNKNYKGSGLLVVKLRKKYSNTIFKKEIIVNGNFNRELLNDLEKHYIRLYNSYKKTNSSFGLNLTSGGDCGFQKKCLNIYQYGLDGKFIKKWNSTLEASNYFLGEVSAINKAINGKSNSAFGFQWKYKYFKNGIKKYQSSSKKVNMFTKNLEFKCTFSSAIEAAKKLNIKYGPIIACCNGDKKSYKNYLWSYEETPIPFINKRELSKLTYQFDLSGNLIKTWKNPKHASDSLKIDESSIYKSAKDGRVVGGFIWKRN